MMTLDAFTKEFIAKYEGAWVFANPQAGKKDLYNIIEVKATPKGNPQLVLWNPKVGNLYINLQTDVEIDFSLPVIGFFNYKGRALASKRVAARQWKRGICSSNFAIDSGAASVLYGNGLKENIEYETLLAAYFPKYPKPSEAIKQLKSGEAQSVAISPNFAITLPCAKASKDTLYVICRHGVIGHIKENSEFTLTNDIFTNEPELEGLKKK